MEVDMAYIRKDQNAVERIALDLNPRALGRGEDQRRSGRGQSRKRYREKEGHGGR
jgi:hypothetical protein